jgi:hypothetical protein
MVIQDVFQKVDVIIINNSIAMNAKRAIFIHLKVVTHVQRKIRDVKNAHSRIIISNVKNALMDLF